MVKANKKETWSVLEHKFGQVADGLGKGIDERIFQTVVAINAHGFRTVASCEGHVDWGIAAPWIDTCSKKTEDLKTISEKLQTLHKRLGLDKVKTSAEHQAAEKKYTEYRNAISQVQEPILKETEKLSMLLNDFYRNRIVPFSTRLILRHSGYYIRLINQGELFQEVQSKKEKEKRLKEFQKEMNDFTEFLKEKYFSV